MNAKKILHLILALIIALSFSACDVILPDPSRTPVPRQTATPAPIQTQKPIITPTPTPSPSPTPIESLKSDVLVASEIFEKFEKALYVEGTMNADEKTMFIKMHLTLDMVKLNMPEEKNGPVAVFNLIDDSAFMYFDGSMFGVAFEKFKIYDALQYQNFIYENAEKIVNLKRDTVNGYDVVYGQMPYIGDTMLLWYSEEFDIPIKIAVRKADEDMTLLNLSHVEELTDLDPVIFEKPRSKIFLPLGDSDDYDLEELLKRFG